MSKTGEVVLAFLVVLYFPIATILWLAGYWMPEVREVGTTLLIIGGILITAAVMTFAAQHFSRGGTDE